MSALIGIITNWWSPLLAGAGTTLALVAISFPFTVVVAVVVGLARLSPVLAVRIIARGYVEFFRGISVVVAIFWLYFALPFFGISLSPIAAAAGALVFVHGAYASEHVRTAVLGVPREQYEAAQALSMSRYQRTRHIVFPQAVASMMPLFGNELILLLKGTSIASLISVAELTEQGHSIYMLTYEAFPTLTAVLLIYFGLAQLLGWGFKKLERKVACWRSPEELGRLAARRAQRTRAVLDPVKARALR